MKFMMLSLAFIGCTLMSAGCGKAPPDAPKSQGQSAGSNSASGAFQSVHGQTGQVAFGKEFSSPPNVTLRPGNGKGQESKYQHNAFQKTSIVETTTTGFRWRNSGKADDFADGEIVWTATGK